MKPLSTVPFRLVGPASVKAFSIFALLCTASHAQALSSTWTSTGTGTADMDFNTSGNWSNGVPGGTAANTDAANFISTTPGTQTSVNLSASDTVQQLTLSTFNYTLTTSASQTLTVDANTAASNSVIQVGSGTTQNINGSVTLTDSASAATNIGIAFATGATPANTSLTFGTGSTLTVGAGGLSAPSSGAYTGTGTINIDGKLVSATGGLVNLTSASTLVFDPTSFTGTFTTLRASSAGSIIDLQVGFSSGIGQINIGGTGAGGGSVFLNAAGAGGTAAVSMGNTTANITAKNTFTFGSNAPTSSVTTQYGGVTLQLANGTTMQTDVLEVDNSNTMNINGAISSPTGTTGVILAVNKTGNGTLLLSNAAGNTYVTNGTNINGGTLLVTNTSGSATGTGPVSISTGTTLAGRGFITGLVSTNAGGSVVAPGTPAGIAGQTAATGMLTLSGGLNATNGLTLNDNVNGAAAVGSLTLANTSTFGGTLTLNFTNLGGSSLRAETIYTLMSGGTWSGTPTVSVGTLPTGYTLDTTYGTNGYNFNLATDTLTVEFAAVAVPEPGTDAMAGGLMLLALGRLAGKRFRRQA